MCGDVKKHPRTLAGRDAETVFSGQLRRRPGLHAADVAIGPHIAKS